MSSTKRKNFLPLDPKYFSSRLRPRISEMLLEELQAPLSRCITIKASYAEVSALIEGKKNVRFVHPYSDEIPDENNQFSGRGSTRYSHVLIDSVTNATAKHLDFNITNNDWLFGLNSSGRFCVELESIEVLRFFIGLIDFIPVPLTHNDYHYAEIKNTSNINSVSQLIFDETDLENEVLLVLYDLIRGIPKKAHASRFVSLLDNGQLINLRDKQSDEETLVTQASYYLLMRANAKEHDKAAWVIAEWIANEKAFPSRKDISDTLDHLDDILSSKGEVPPEYSSVNQNTDNAKAEIFKRAIKVLITNLLVEALEISAKKP